MGKDITIRYWCNICKKTVSVKLIESFQKKIKDTADRWPYPLIQSHKDHWVMVYLDQDFRERGVVTTKLEFP